MIFDTQNSKKIEGSYIYTHFLNAVTLKKLYTKGLITVMGK